MWWRVPTVDAALELLAADPAVQSSNARLLIELYCDRLLVVTEETRKDAGERFVLRGTKC